MSFGITELVIVLVIVLLLFGTTKLKSLGGDLGSAIKGFRTAVSDEEEIKSVTDSSEEEASSTLQQTEQSESKS
jgi:sec-independent protein translocase protein TatA